MSSRMRLIPSTTLHWAPRAMSRKPIGACRAGPVTCNTPPWCGPKDGVTAGDTSATGGMGTGVSVAHARWRGICPLPAEIGYIRLRPLQGVRTPLTSEAMVPEFEDFSLLIGDVYDAALDPGLWPHVLQRVCGFVGGAASGLFSKDSANQSGEM